LPTINNADLVRTSLADFGFCPPLIDTLVKRLSSYQLYQHGGVRAGQNTAASQTASLQFEGTVKNRANESGASVRTQNDADKLVRNATPELLAKNRFIRLVS
jgi:hypothetical protein